MSPSPVPDRPRLPAWLRPYVRRPGEVQFGLLPGAPVVEGVTPGEAALLAGLDGSLTREQTYAVAAAAGTGRKRWRDVLLLATSLGVLVDAATVVGTVGAPMRVPHVLTDAPPARPSSP
ncbi:hypothetical protein, partial [Intrasporangium flavum]|uniref:hypothetical protein n=1 Tax=Intrasporangium flavum TaxID=1428657 RepID=UPI001A96ED22